MMNLHNSTIICDLQFGSTGKGLMAGYLAMVEQPDVVVHAFGPNSGHTYIDQNNRVFIHRMLANGIVSPRLKYHLIGPGAVIDLDVLIKEIECAGDVLAVNRVEVIIHPHACIVHPRHVAKEINTMTGIGSTKKGTGAALIEKLERDPLKGDIIAGAITTPIERKAAEYGVPLRVGTVAEYDQIIDGASHIQIEGAQGYSLGLNSGFYPYVTSRECTPAQIASDCLVPLPKIGRIVGCLRTYPIRVSNRYNAEGEMIGWSGPCYADQQEITFTSIGQPIELTTVTKLPRRVFTFSEQQASQAIRQTCPTDVVLGFANYCTLERVDQLIGIINAIGKSHNGSRVTFATYGATVRDVMDLEQQGYYKTR